MLNSYDISHMQLQNYLQKGITYNAYLELTETLVAQNKSSGSEQSDDLATYTKLNLQRMRRIGKTTTLLPELLKTLNQIDSPQIWLLLSETWCGDAAQNLPVINLMAEANPKIQLRILLRDQNLELMDAYLTNGARSIPKLICFDAVKNIELFNWGPRPAGAQTLAIELKHSGADKETKGLALQKWYAADKGISCQNEINEELLKTMEIKT